jgi:hypothetical protein
MKCEFTADEIEIRECKAEDVDDSLKRLWLALANGMLIEHYIVPSEANADTWVKFVREGLSSGKTFLLVARSRGELVGFVFASFTCGFRF